MMEAEVRQQLDAIQFQRGRVQAIREVAEFVSTHPSILTSPAAKDLARDVLDKCVAIVNAT